MKLVQLIRLDPSTEENLTKDPAYFEALMKSDWASVARCVHKHVGRILAVPPASVDKLEWGGYCVVNAQSREVVGSCAYKSPPSADGVVEIAYFTYPGFEGQGYATTMANKLIEMARSSKEVKRIIAHTLPNKNASTRVLEKASMEFVGEINDPEDGPVWRWEAPAE